MLPESRWSTPRMGTRNIIEITSESLAFWLGIRYMIEEEMGHRTSLSGRNATAEVVTLRLYSASVSAANATGNGATPASGRGRKFPCRDTARLRPRKSLTPRVHCLCTDLIVSLRPRIEWMRRRRLTERGARRTNFGVCHVPVRQEKRSCDDFNTAVFELRNDGSSQISDSFGLQEPFHGFTIEREAQATGDVDDESPEGHVRNVVCQSMMLKSGIDGTSKSRKPTPHEGISRGQRRNLEHLLKEYSESSLAYRKAHPDKLL
ncbi:hypothetical protein EVAR_28236_1 [Eumeta japonica]|uniref:Uncharacterized protein n=1 Tax=Eumeta variegata TaxID=151549 RepID=A0A4C1V717_EUMVA|nr:hypothetical protein EVAR_28236_1 [Eumeta japonica]